MPDRTLTYNVQVNNASVKQAGKTVKDVFQRELSDVQIGGTAAGGGRTSGGGGGLSLGSLLGKGLGVLGIGLGARELGQMAVGMAQLGTSVQRSSEAFQLLSGGSANAAANMEAVKRATGGAITGMGAMQIANQANLLGFAKTSEQLERVTKLATISGRVMGQDVVTQLQNMQSAAANLSFVRLDTLGINAEKVKARFAELNKTMDDTAAFTQAMIEVGEVGFKALEGSSLTAASGFEVLKGRIQELKEEASGPFKMADDLAKLLAISLGAEEKPEDRIDAVIDRVKELKGIIAGRQAENKSAIGMFADPAAVEKGAAALQKVADNAKLLDAAIAAGVPGAQALQDKLLDLGTTAANQPGVSDEMIGSIDMAVEAVGRLIAAWGMAKAAAGEAESAASAATGQWSLAAAQEAIQAGQIADQARFESQMAILRQQTAGARGELAVEGAQADQIAQVLQDIEDKRLDMFWKGAAENRDAARRADQKAADEAEAAWKKSAAEVEARWKAAIGSIPGLPGTGRSPVTQEQMDLAAAGIPQRFADSFLREVEDVLINGVQRPNVDIEQIRALTAQSAGLTGEQVGGLSNEQLAKMFGGEFTSGRLFALPEVQANIGQFLDEGAIEKGLQQNAAGEQGKQFVDKWLKQRFGGDYDMSFMAEGMATGLQTALQGGEGGVDFAGPTLEAVAGQFTEESLGTLSGVSKLMVDRLTLEWGNDVTSAPWAVSMMTAILNQLAGQIEALKNQNGGT